jgi:F-type H+-transporting ATPase subunit d
MQIFYSHQTRPTKMRSETLKKIAQFKQKQTALLKMKQDLLVTLPSYNLQNKQVLKNAQEALERFTPTKLDISQELNTLSKLRVQAVQDAQKTQEMLAKEMTELQLLLKDIEEARPIDQLTVDDIAKASDLDEKVEKMAKRGQWKVPGYYEKFGEFSVGF